MKSGRKWAVLKVNGRMFAFEKTVQFWAFRQSSFSVRFDIWLLHTTVKLTELTVRLQSSWSSTSTTSNIRRIFPKIRRIRKSNIFDEFEKYSIEYFLFFRIFLVLRKKKFVEYSKVSNIRRIYFEKIFSVKKIRRIFEGFFLVEYSTNFQKSKWDIIDRRIFDSNIRKILMKHV